jgi:hypothetical protein
LGDARKIQALSFTGIHYSQALDLPAAGLFLEKIVFIFSQMRLVSKSPYLSGLN